MQVLSKPKCWTVLGRTSQCLRFISIMLVSAGLLMGSEAQFESPEQASASLAKLLRISFAPPDVWVTVKRIDQVDDVLIEDITWTSTDDKSPVAYVIKPASSSSPLPAVVCLHGSSGSRDSMVSEHFGRGQWVRHGSSEPHQRLLGWARELAKRGFVTLALTQRGLDRRLPNTNDQSKDLLVHGRTLMGAIVDEIRQAITYLASRPDVDPKRIGVAGMSFGGITSFYSWIVDRRIAAAASICGGVGSVEVLLRKGTPGYHGFYWWIPDMLTVGDQGAFAAAMAPRPLMLWAPRSDIGMPEEGVNLFLETVRPAYLASIDPSSLTVIQPEGEHQFSLEAFEALVTFFKHSLNEPRGIP